MTSPSTGVEQQSAPRADQYPAPYADRVKTHESFFGLFGGPLAWFVQLCAGYSMASEACFHDGSRALAPSPGQQWTWPAMTLVAAAAVLIALLSLLVSWRAFKRTRKEAQGDSRHLAEVGSGRTRFLSLWGMILGAGFAVAAALTFIAFFTLPRCAG
jgi:hypothetical protein